MEFSRKAKELSEVFNSGPNQANLAKELTHDHRTIQQNITRFCIAWIKECAKDEYQIDGRNEASKETAQIIAECVDLDDVCLPYV